MVQADCNLCKRQESASIKIKKYKDVGEVGCTVKCCTDCRDNLGTTQSHKSLERRMGSYFARMMKKDLYRKQASLVDLCCDTIAGNTDLMTQTLDTMGQYNKTLVISLKRALIAKNITRLNSKAFDLVDRITGESPEHSFKLSHTIINKPIAPASEDDNTQLDEIEDDDSWFGFEWDLD